MGGIGSGAPQGNRNNMRHGLKAGKLPAGCLYLEKQQQAIRRSLEDAVAECKGEVSPRDAGYIFAACDGYRQAKLSAHWLRKAGPKLSASERERHSDGMAKGVDRFVRYLDKLNLDGDRGERIIQTLYQRIPAPEIAE